MDYEKKYIKYKTKYVKLQNEKNLDIIEGHNSSDNKPNYTETVSEPWFTLISMGLKSVEGRKNKGRFKEMKVGDIVA